ncbi:hypothetical protein CCH79_00013234 [Gambusia affinis]|uniref:Uncharacterized protein n=1 Tax=Gambusia affinis TaxID=33528 RepID=A0A315V1A1_GAMAF|nr:hypothetical protein CCH79_00013234 [Gambusia affinis]
MVLPVPVPAKWRNLKLLLRQSLNRVVVSSSWCSATTASSRFGRVCTSTGSTRVVGGFETLTAMENVECDTKTDKPKSEIKLISTSVFVDPYEEADAQIAAEREKELQKQEEEKQQTNMALKKAKEDQAPKTFKEGVGKYINPAAAKRRAAEDEGGPSTSGQTAKKSKGKTSFGDFSSW